MPSNSEDLGKAFPFLPCTCDKCLFWVSGPLLDIGDMKVNKIGFVLALSGKRDIQQQNKNTNTNTGEEAEEGDRQGCVYGVGGTHSSGALGKTSLKGGFLNSSLKTEEATM